MNNLEDSEKFPCVCCGYMVHSAFCAGELCPICAYQDNLEQLIDPCKKGTEQNNLIQEQRNFLRKGIAREFTSLRNTRRNDWRPVIPKLDDFGTPEKQALVRKTPDQLYYWTPTFWNAQARGSALKDELDLAHKLSIFNRAQVEISEYSGCFRCCSVFKSNLITKWCDRGLTPICPNCSIDAVLAGSSGFSLTQEFLKRMKSKWFHNET